MPSEAPVAFLLYLFASTQLLQWCVFALTVTTDIEMCLISEPTLWMCICAPLVIVPSHFYLFVYKHRLSGQVPKPILCAEGKKQLVDIRTVFLGVQVVFPLKKICHCKLYFGMFNKCFIYMCGQ